MAGPIFECPATIQPVPSAPVLTSEQQQQQADLLAQVSRLISDLNPTAEESSALTAWADAACANRFLRATKFDLAASITRLGATLAWRKEYRPDLITPEEVEPEAVTGKQFLSGFDKKGHPLLFLVPRNENTKTYDRQIRYSVFMLEKAIKLMPASVERVD
ncbi:hypothetical protein HDU98_000895, partial [Podochytrium sp. JEL0797]